MSSTTPNPREATSSVEVTLNFVSFPTFSDPFRMWYGFGAAGTYSIRMENKVSKAQWQCALSDDVSKYGPAGIPFDGLLDFLHAALSARDCPPDQVAAEREPSMATVSCKSVTGDMVLSLTLQFSKIWTSLYSFTLTPVKLDPVSVVSAKLRDAEEMIRSLQQKAIRDIVSAHETTWNRTTNAIAWNPANNAITSLVTVDAGNTALLRFKKSGTFQIIFASSFLNTSYPMSIQVYGNGTAVVYSASFYGCGTCVVTVDEGTTMAVMGSPNLGNAAVVNIPKLTVELLR